MSKNVIQAIKILDAADMSQSTLTSTTVEVPYLDNAGLEVTWTGTPTGTIEVKCSNSNSTFYALTFDPVLDQPSGSSGGYLINLNQLPFRYVRVVYTRTSGTGALTVWFSAKEV